MLDIVAFKPWLFYTIVERASPSIAHLFKYRTLCSAGDP